MKTKLTEKQLGIEIDKLVEESKSEYIIPTEEYVNLGDIQDEIIKLNKDLRYAKTSTRKTDIKAEIILKNDEVKKHILKWIENNIYPFYKLFWVVDATYITFVTARNSGKTINIAMRILYRIYQEPLANMLVLRKHLNDHLDTTLSAFQKILSWMERDLNYDFELDWQINRGNSDMRMIFKSTGQTIFFKSLVTHKLGFDISNNGFIDITWLEEFASPSDNAEITDYQAYQKLMDYSSATERHINEDNRDKCLNQTFISQNPWRPTFVETYFLWPVLGEEINEEELIEKGIVWGYNDTLYKGRPLFSAIGTIFALNPRLTIEYKDRLEMLKQTDPEKYRTEALGLDYVPEGQVFGKEVLSNIPHLTEQQIIDNYQSGGYSHFEIGLDWGQNDEVNLQLWGFLGNAIKDCELHLIRRWVYNPSEETIKDQNHIKLTAPQKTDIIAKTCAIWLQEFNIKNKQWLLNYDNRDGGIADFLRQDIKRLEIKKLLVVPCEKHGDNGIANRIITIIFLSGQRRIKIHVNYIKKWKSKASTIEYTSNPDERKWDDRKGMYDDMDATCYAIGRYNKQFGAPIFKKGK